MTTLELIEKHGIGNNCLSDAYDKGREDVIDEFADYIKKHFRIGVNTIDDVVKEFKEQKNERT